MIIFPGFGESSDMFCSISSFKTKQKQQSEAKYLKIDCINFYSCGEWLLYDFHYNNFWQGRTSSNVYGQLVSELIRNKDSARKTPEMDGTLHSLLDKRYELSLQQILCPEEIKNATDLKLDSTELLTITEFENGLFNILDKTNNDKDKTINELVNLYTKMLKRMNVINE